MGDGDIEFNAIKLIKKEFNISKLKIIHMIQKPTINQVMGQINVIITKLDYIINHDGNLNITLKI